MSFTLKKSNNEYYYSFELNNLAYSFEIHISSILDEEYSKNLKILLIDSTDTIIINANFHERCSKNSNNNYIEILVPNHNISYHNNPLTLKIIDNNIESIDFSVEVKISSIEV